MASGEATEKLYPDVLPWALEPNYYAHVNALTAEGLHDKSAIAEQLAWRDMVIEALTDRVRQLELDAGNRAHRPTLFVERATRLFDLAEGEIRNRGRGTVRAAAARQLVARALRIEFGWTLQEIAVYLRRSGHDVIIVALKRAEAMLRDERNAEAYAQITAP